MTTLPQGATPYSGGAMIIMTIYGLSSTIAPCEGNIVLQRYVRVLAHLLMTSLDSFPLVSICSHKFTFFATAEHTKKCTDRGVVGFLKLRLKSNETMKIEKSQTNTPQN
jgi:hypothetical protein